MSAPIAPQPTTDRNLLFGILALQMDFISRDALIAAMNAWVLDKAKPLGRILLEQQAFNVEEHDLLQALVQKHIQKHGGDVQKSLAAVSSVGSVRQQLQQVQDADLQASLAHVSADRGEEFDSVPTRPPSIGTPTSSGLRFRILRQHAKGGLGEVFVAHDEELHREVALKEIQDRYADHQHNRTRFVLEAEITGGLEHPGIVPVYGLGQYADGRPFYAMRFIKGDSLQEAIAQFHQADTSGRDTGERALALRQLLSRFVDVCNAIAYAHSRGVLHRDLKPGNIMLGKYGETLVVDWGLAKLLGRAESTTDPMEGAIRPSSASGSAPTQMGSAIGTPAYMPPEQAAGKLDQLGPASDVYSLGATLYCLLTGKAPFEGRQDEVLRKVQRGEFPRPRQVKPSVPAALEAVCLKAMDLRPDRRYPDPRALATDVERWLADEPVSAWREPWHLRAGRWARRHQTLVSVAATAILLLILAAGTAAWWLDRQRTEQRRGVESALTEVLRLQGQGRWSEARAVLGQTRDRLGHNGPRDLQERLDQGERNLDLVARLDAIRIKSATLTEGQLHFKGVEQEYEKAFHEVGDIEVNGDVAMVASWVRESPVRDTLLGALDDWASSTKNQQLRSWLLSVSRLADADPWRQRVRDSTTWEDKAALVTLTTSKELTEQSPQFLVGLASQIGRLGADPEPLFRTGRSLYPGDFWINFGLGFALWKNKKPADAVAFFLCALALRPGTAVIHHNLGVVLAEIGRMHEAAAEFRKAIELDPDFAAAHFSLGSFLMKTGQLKEAVTANRKAIELDPSYASARDNLGSILGQMGRLEEAIAELRKAIELDPNSAHARTNLGNALLHMGRREEASAELRKAIELDPNSANPRVGLGLVLQEQGHVEEAIAEFKKAIELDPKFAGAHSNLGLLLHGKGRADEAIAEFKKAIELDPKIAGAYSNLGLALLAKGRVDEAIDECKKATELDPRDAGPHSNLGNALFAKGRVDEAIDEYKKTIELNPQGAADHGTFSRLGVALLQQGRFTETRQAIQRCLELLPANHPHRPYYLGQQRQCEQMLALDEKLPVILKGEVKPANSDEQIGLAQLCRIKKRYAAAARFFADAFAAQPKLADDLQAGHRYYAACFAALAAAGQGEDAATIDDKERARLRKQALNWLSADLALRRVQIEKGTPQEHTNAQSMLRIWQQDANLASIRDAAALDRLPEAERAECRKLWNDVAALLKK